MTQLQRAPGLCVSAFTNKTRRWPGGVRVVPLYGWGVGGGSAVIDGGFAHRQWDEPQVAANFAAAADTISGSPEAWDLVTDGRYYRTFIGFRITDDSWQGEIGIKVGAATAKILVLGAATIPGYYGFYLTGGAGAEAFNQFAAGDSIIARAYRTSGAGSIRLDQLYFIPHITATSAQKEDARYLTPGDVGPLAAFVNDVMVLSGSSSVQDTQVVDYALDSTPAEWEWSAFTWSGPNPNSHQSQAIQDFDAAYPRYCYALCRHVTSAADIFGAHATFGVDSVPRESALIWNNGWGLYYFGPFSHDAAEIQFALWQHTVPPLARVPFSVDSTDISEVRIDDLFLPSSYWDDVVTTIENKVVTPVPAGTQPDYVEPTKEGIAIAFDSETLAAPVWSRVDV